MKKLFEPIPHTADLQIRVYGKSKKELFKHALIGMFQAIEPKTDQCIRKGDFLECERLPCVREIEVEAPDQVALLVDYLSEALYLSDVHDEAYLDASIHTLSDTALTATIKGITIVGFNVEIKAVTYHGLEFKKVDDTWQVDIVFDI